MQEKHKCKDEDMTKAWQTEGYSAVQLKVNEEEAACTVGGGVAGGPASWDSHHMQPAALYTHHTHAAIACWTHNKYLRK